MKKAPAGIAAIMTRALTLLYREIGAVDTARFLNQLTSGFGNTTHERDQIIGGATVGQPGAESKQRRAKGEGRAKSSRRPLRRSK